jgi:parallel beta-helix repeat protein
MGENKMKKMKMLFEAMIVVAIVSALMTPESAIKMNDRIFDIHTKNIFDDAIQPTLVDNIPPSITINFAGNLGDNGGPYWQPPGESVSLVNHTVEKWQDGYYTNDSRQHEDWMYINVTVNDTGSVAEVWLHWYDATTSIWNNNSYQFMHTVGDFWEFNTSNNITNIESSHDYSFDVFAKDAAGNSNLEQWEKTGLGGILTRRHVQLSCPELDITYHPFYLREYTSETGIYGNEDLCFPGACPDRDRLHHDQGPANTLTDTGYLNSSIPTDDVEIRYCTNVVAHWFEDNACAKSFRLENTYFHYWYNNIGIVGCGKSRKVAGECIEFYYPPGKNESRSNITYNNGIFYLDTNLLSINQSKQELFGDNNIYELFVKFAGPNIRIISNRSFMSFVIFNVPDNDTLNSSHFDTDNDSLSDWSELYDTYTSPFHKDTDNDGASDWEEVNAYLFGYNNSDPNNYSDTTVYRRELTVYSGGPYYGEVDESIEFSGFAVGGQPPYNYSWDFGDGNISEEQNASHAYSHLGVYTVNLTVIDSEHNRSYDVTTASIQNPIVWVDDGFNETIPGWNLTHFNTIQKGIDNVLRDGHVIVYDGIYCENIVINKPLTLHGNDTNSTIIDGNNSGIAVQIRANDVKVTGFTIQSCEYNQSTYDYHAIVIDSDHTTIIRNTIMKSRFGIFLKIRSTNNCIQWNTISNNKRGILLRGSSDNIIFGNKILHNYNYGIYLKEGAEHNHIYDNIIINDTCGIYIKKSPGNPQEPSPSPINNTIYHNNFINNSQNACDQSNNTWYKESIQHGNYWDDFEQNPGYPEFYEIPCGSNVDLYPLTDPWVMVLGDLDHDGDVDLFDLIQVLAHYGITEDVTYEMGDIDGDGDIDLADLSILLTNYG